MGTGRVGPAGAAALLAACLLASCTAPAPAPRWHQVALPEQAWPSSLARHGDDLVVGGRLAGRPMLLRIAADGGLTDIPLAPGGGYAAAADLVWVSPGDDGLLALGVARGGAHGNQRWTSWQGPADGPVRDHDQPFSTFGGHEAGPLLGILRPGPAVVVGSRAGSAGFSAAVWTARGTRWVRSDAIDPLLASGPDRVLTFRAATAVGDTVLIAGAETGLAGAVLQSPVLWAGAPEGPWRAIHLIVPDSLATATGLAQATSVACGTAACWVAGWVRGSPVAWQLDLAGDTSVPAVLPGAGGSPTDPLAVLTVAADVPVVATNGEPAVLAWRCADEWRTGPVPAGRTTVLTAIGNRLYAITQTASGAALWQAGAGIGAC